MKRGGNLDEKEREWTMREKSGPKREIPLSKSHLFGSAWKVSRPLGFMFSFWPLYDCERGEGKKVDYVLFRC